MIRFFLFLLIALIALLLESSWFAAWPTDRWRLELVWLLVLYLGFSVSLREGAILIILLGLIEDLWGTPVLGFFTTLYLLFFILLRTFIANLYVETLWARLMWVGAVSLLATLVEEGLMSLLGMGTGLHRFFLTHGLVQALFNMIAAAVLFPLLERLERAFSIQTA